MNDSLHVCVLNGVAHLDEQLEPLVRGKRFLIAIARDRQAPKELHHEVRPAVVRRAGVEDARDVRVMHHRQRLPLRIEACDDVPRIHAELDDLDRDRAFHRPKLFGFVHDTHPALAKRRDDPIWPDLIGHLARLQILSLRRYWTAQRAVAGLWGVETKQFLNRP